MLFTRGHTVVQINCDSGIMYTSQWRNMSWEMDSSTRREYIPVDSHAASMLHTVAESISQTRW